MCDGRFTYSASAHSLVHTYCLDFLQADAGFQRRVNVPVPTEAVRRRMLSALLRPLLVRERMQMRSELVVGGEQEAITTTTASGNTVSGCGDEAQQQQAVTAAVAATAPPAAAAAGPSSANAVPVPRIPAVVVAAAAGRVSGAWSSVLAPHTAGFGYDDLCKLCMEATGRAAQRQWQQQQQQQRRRRWWWWC